MVKGGIVEVLLRKNIATTIQTYREHIGRLKQDKSIDEETIFQCEVILNSFEEAMELSKIKYAFQYFKLELADIFRF